MASIRSVWAVASAVLLFVATARADDAPAPPLSPDVPPAEAPSVEAPETSHLPPVGLGIEEIEIVREKRREEPPIFEVTPVEAEVIDSQRLRELPARDAGDIAANLTGVRVQRRVQGQAAAASVEGLPPEYTRLLVDGQHYTGELGGVGDLADLPLANLERLTLLRGPQAMRYGSDVGGAALLAETRAPPLDPGYRFSLDGGSGDDAQHYASQVSSARVGRFGAVLATSYRGIDGFGPRGSDAAVPATRNDWWEKYQDAYTSLRYSASESLELRSNLGWRKDQDAFEQETGGGQGERETARWLASAGFEAHFGADTTLDAELFRYLSDTDSDVGRGFSLREEDWKLDVALRQQLYLFRIEPTLTLGVDTHLPTLALRESSVAPGSGAGDSDSDVDEDYSATGLYALASIPVTDWATLEGGLREQLDSRYDDKLLPQVALLLEPFDGLRLRGAWGQSYRTPSLRDLYQPAVPQLGGAYFLAGNRDLDTESAVGIRAGIEYLPTDRLSLSATFFNNRVDDHIRSSAAGSIQIGEEHRPPPRDPSSRFCQQFPTHIDCQPIIVPLLSPLFRKSNLDLVRTRGVEAQLRWAPLDNLDLRVGYTYLTTQVDSPTIDIEELPNEPRHTVDLAGTFSVPRLESLITLQARWRDSALQEGSGTGLASFTGLERSDPAWLLDARLVQPLRGGLALYLDAENLTNQDAVDSYEIRGRTFFVGLRFDLERDAWSAP